MHSAPSLLIILTAGLASQWVAWRLRLPAIVVLITSGLLIGPVTGMVELGLSASELSELIGLGVAIILFEGGMDLKLAEFRRVGHGIGRLTIIAPPLAWLLGSFAAHLVAGLSWPVAFVLGAILVVTGPTVILPLLRQARLNKESASLLKWEGIVNDPIGVLLAVLTFQYFVFVGTDVTRLLLGIAAAVAAGALGGAGGWLTGWLFRRGMVPEHLKPAMLMVLVLLVYWASNLVQREAGLLGVTVMGLVVGNTELVEREDLQRFKENLTVILLSILFIVIPTQLNARHLDLIDWRILLFVLAILFLVRPLSILLATIGAPMRREDRLLLAWIAPRGIVAAATAGIFGPAMVAAGYPDGDKLLPIIFLVILATVIAHGLSIGAVARRLRLAASGENGLLIVGAWPWNLALAQALKKHEVDVLVADGGYHRLKTARMEGIEVYYGEVLSEHAEQTLETHHLTYLLCATENDFYNALVCKAQGHRFGRHRTFQLATHQESSQGVKRLTLQQRGYIAFAAAADFETLQARLSEGWVVQSTRLTEAYDLDQFTQRLGVPGSAWFMLGVVASDGEFRLYSDEQSFTPEPGSVVLYFAPAPKRNELGGKVEAHAAEGNFSASVP